jgi:transposase InsO family protein
MRNEHLNERLFLGLDHARTRITAWIADYNEQRPHSATGLSHTRPLRPQSHATRRKTTRGSSRRWMKVQGQVSGLRQVRHFLPALD